MVRLKGGDPMIFGRAGEEIAACRAANIPVEVVPGISAAQGAASRLLVSLTHRAQARRVQYVTGHDRDGKLPADIDWRSLADPAATTIVYMPKKTLRAVERARDRAGARSGDACGRGRECDAAGRDDRCRRRSRDIAERIEAAALDGPVLVMIGRVLASVIGAQERGEEASAPHDALRRRIDENRLARRALL